MEARALTVVIVENVVGTGEEGEEVAITEAVEKDELVVEAVNAVGLVDDGAGDSVVLSAEEGLEGFADVVETEDVEEVGAGSEDV